MITGGVAVSANRKYGKPNMAALPKDLGRAVIVEILSSRKLDSEALYARADELEQKMIAAEQHERESSE